MWVFLLDVAIVVIWFALNHSQQKTETLDRGSHWSYSHRR